MSLVNLNCLTDDSYTQALIPFMIVFSTQVIAHSVRRQHTDIHRFEKISNIVKQFKLSCRSVQAYLITVLS